MTGTLEAPEVAVAVPARRGRRTVAWVAGVVAAVLLLFVGLLATGQDAQSRIASSPLVGKAAPEVTGTSLEGRTVRLSSLRGRYVVLNFFATWCVPCQREHDDLLRFHQRHDPVGDAAVLAVIYDDEPDDVRRFLQRHGGGWPVLIDPRGKVSLDFGVRGIPESFLIDPDGRVISRIVGGVELNQLEGMLAQAKAVRGGAG